MPNGTSATTQTAGDNTTKLATTAFVQSASSARLPYYTIAELRAFVSGDVTNKPNVYITDTGKEGIFEYDPNDAAAICTFTGSMAGGLLTVTAITSGYLAVGQYIEGGSTPKGTKIVGFNTGTGGTGTYYLNTSSTVSSTTLTSNTANGALFVGSISGTTLTVSSVSTGVIEVGQYVTGSNITTGTRIISAGTGIGGTGTYTVSVSQTVASTTISYDNLGTFLVTTTGARYKRVFENYVNPKWFGAVGNGVTNDTEAFVVSLSAKKDLFVPKGTYLVNDTLDVFANITCEKDAKFKIANNYVGTLFRIRSLKGLNLKNLYIDAMGTGIRVTGIKIEGLWNSTIDSPSFLANESDTDTSSIAMDIQTSQTTNSLFGVYTLTINNPYFIRGKYGIKTTQTLTDSLNQVGITHLVINNGWISTYKKYGIFLNNAVNFIINNTAFDNLLSGSAGAKFNNCQQGAIFLGEYNSGELFNISPNCSLIRINAPRGIPSGAIVGKNYSLSTADMVRLAPTNVDGYQTTIEGRYNSLVPFRIQGDYYGSNVDLISFNTTHGLSPRTNNPDNANGSYLLALNEGGGMVKMPTNKYSEGTAAPTTGTWSQGDYRRNTTPSAGGYFGWVCVTGGTPGTWKGYGLIQN